MMSVRSNRFAKFSELRITISAVEVAQNLIVGSILLYDVNDMLDQPPQAAKQLIVLRNPADSKRIVSGHCPGKFVQGSSIGQFEALKT